MIRNRLAVLLAERGLKITRVAKDTGISRNTITTTAQNDSEMIRLETINTLCNYLGVTPSEFFDYEPIDFDFSIYVNKLSFRYSDDFAGDNSGDGLIEISNIDLDLIMDVKKHQQVKSFELKCSLSSEKTFYLHENQPPIEVDIEFENDEEKKAYINEIDRKISASFHQDIYMKMSDALVNELKKSFINKANEEELYKPNQMMHIERFFNEFLKVTICSDVFKPF